MSEISSLYSSRQTVYRKPGKRSEKSKHGDVKHIVYKEGEPSYTEVIKVNRQERDDTAEQRRSSPRRIRSAGAEVQERRSSEQVLEKKKKKLSDRLKKAIRQSQTLWSEKDGIWISYQGSSGFLVKQFDTSNRVISHQLMTTSQIMESSIPGLLDTSWKTV